MYLLYTLKSELSEFTYIDLLDQLAISLIYTVLLTQKKILHQHKFAF